MSGSNHPHSEEYNWPKAFTECVFIVCVTIVILCGLHWWLK